jgi:hypothetical protein
MVEAAEEHELELAVELLAKGAYVSRDFFFG